MPTSQDLVIFVDNNNNDKVTDQSLYPSVHAYRVKILADLKFGRIP